MESVLVMPSEFEKNQRAKAKTLINGGIEILVRDHMGRRTMRVGDLAEHLRGELTKLVIVKWEDLDLEFISEDGEENPKQVTDNCRIRIKEKPKSALLENVVKRAHAAQITCVKKIMQGDHHQRIGRLMDVEVPFTKWDLFRLDKKHLKKWGYRIEGDWTHGKLFAHATDSMVRNKFKIEAMTSEASETTEYDE